MKKRLFSLLLVVLLFCSITPIASAANGEEEGAAETLYALGLFKGTGTNPDGTPIFDLDKTPTRNQAIIMLIRLLGKEEEALAGTWEIPFTDVSEGMRPYVGYAYANGLTNGTSATTFSGSNPIKSTQYIVFVLRALGYEDGVDFQWNNAWEFARELFINRNDYTSATRLTRGDVAIVSRNALRSKMKDSDMHLIERVCDKPLDPNLPITENSFCFFYPYPPPDDIAGDLTLSGWGHGNPRGWREFTLIINGSIVTDGYTVECPTEGFCDTVRIEDNGHFVVSAARKGQATVFVTYEGVTANFRFISYSD